jgi:hypothetical protein
VRGAVQQKSWYLLSAQYLSNRSALAPDPADADIDDLRPWVEDQAADGRQSNPEDEVADTHDRMFVSARLI